MKDFGKRDILTLILIFMASFFPFFQGCSGGGGGEGPSNPPPGPPSTSSAQSLSIGIVGVGESKLTTDQTPVNIAGYANSDIGIQKVEFTNETTGQSGETTGTSEWSANINLIKGDNNLKFTHQLHKKCG